MRVLKDLNALLEFIEDNPEWGWKTKFDLCVDHIEELEYEHKQLRKLVEQMKCCENCKHYSDVGEFAPEYVCHIVKEKCTVEKYESWELKE
jgi:hypothetical protein